MPAYSSINLHPSTHPLSSLHSRTYDVICIGSGWAGRITAARCVKAGLTALIIENELVGGDCPFWACVPSKALLRSNEALESARGVGGARERVTPDASVDVEAVFKRRDESSANWDDTKALVPLLESSGAELVRGTGTIIGVKKVRAEAHDGGSVELEAQHAVVVCTGSTSVIPDVPGLREAEPWTARQATTASSVPKSLVILGAGAVGCEMATAYAGFGSQVSVVTSTEEILPKMDPEAGKIVREELGSRGVKFFLGTKASRVSKDAEGTLTIELSNGTTISATQILVATGRRPQTSNVGLESLSLPTNGTPLPVDDSLCVASVPGRWLYAAGDVNGRAPLTHMCKYHGWVAGNAIVAAARSSGTAHAPPAPWSPTAATADALALPQVVFTDPHVASVGLTRTAAARQGRKVREVTAPAITLGARLHVDGYQDGWAQWIVGAEDGRLLGATIVGRDVAELLHASTVAIVGEMTVERLASAIPCFPTMSEVYWNLVQAAVW